MPWLTDCTGAAELAFGRSRITSLHVPFTLSGGERRSTSDTFRRPRSCRRVGFACTPLRSSQSRLSPDQSRSRPSRGRSFRVARAFLSPGRPNRSEIPRASVRHSSSSGSFLHIRHRAPRRVHRSIRSRAVGSAAIPAKPVRRSRCGRRSVGRRSRSRDQSGRGSKQSGRCRGPGGVEARAAWWKWTRWARLGVGLGAAGELVKGPEQLQPVRLAFFGVKLRREQVLA